MPHDFNGPRIDPRHWLSVAVKRHEVNYSPWLPGDIAPVRVGWYERCFTDGTVRHYWDGAKWRPYKGTFAPEHWRQVGDYPAWRGLAATTKEASNGN